MDYLAALLPSAGLAVLFVLLMRSILHADRRERAAAAKARAERGGKKPANGGANETGTPS
ncbi:hypothetical protein [Kineococcus sp. SYSU DK003]|uniref:hypothetical protein n=1 Tax=Kineococcus sp. SYSU DK003 TaxID=3383124 RepID=UPI003D7D23A5